MPYTISDFQKIISQSIDVKQKILTNTALLLNISQICQEIITAFRQGNKVLLCGNGGSAADAQHIAAELSGRFYLNRDPLFAEALHVNSSYLTAVANDFGYASVYARLLKGIGRKGDIFIGISTSGNSENVLQAFQTAQELEMITVAMTGQGGGKMRGCARYLLDVPSNDTPRVQESHIMLGHLICQFVEQELFGHSSQKNGC